MARSRAASAPNLRCTTGGPVCASSPDGRFEAPADLRPGVWTTLELAVTKSSVQVSVDGVDVLVVAETKAPARSGPVGLFVDIGTEAFFADLTIAAG